MITNKRLSRLGFLFWIFIIGCGYFAHPTTASAATLPPGYQMSVTESASTMTYGGVFPDFQAQLTVPTDDPLTNPNNFYIMIDSQIVGFGSPGPAPTYSINLPGKFVPMKLPGGQHSVVAGYYSIQLKTAIESTPITLTVLPASPALSCGFITPLPHMLPSPSL